MLVESPYSGKGVEAIRYLACCILDSILRGEAPIASHALYPLALPERAVSDGLDWPRDAYGQKLQGRDIGKQCHNALSLLHELVANGDTMPILVVGYVDTGETAGMQWGEDYQKRTLRGAARDIWESGNWPTSARWEATNEEPP